MLSKIANPTERAYLKEIIDGVKLEPNLAKEAEGSSTNLIQEILENLKLGGPWHAGTSIDGRAISDVEFMDFLWDTIESTYKNLGQSVPLDTAVRMTNSRHIPAGLVRHIANSDILDLPSEQRFDLVIEASNSCVNVPAIATWIRETLTSIFADMLMADSTDEDAEGWELSAQTAKELVSKNVYYKMLSDIVDSNNPDYTSKSIEEVVEEPLDIVEVTKEKLRDLILNIIKSNPDIMRADELTRDIKIIGLLEEELQSEVDRDMAFDLLDNINNS